jgi:hypothetical protein
MDKPYRPVVEGEKKLAGRILTADGIFRGASVIND